MKIVHESDCPERGESELCLCIKRYCTDLKNSHDVLEDELKATRDEALDIICKSKGIQILDKKDFEKFNKAIMERMKI